MAEIENNEYAFTKVSFTATNKKDFENLKKSLQLDKILDLDLKDVNMENIEKIVESKSEKQFELGFLDPNKGSIRTSEPYLKILNEENEINMHIDENNFQIKLHLTDTYMHSSKFGEKDEYIKDTIKNIAKENNSELLFIHSEVRFADRTGNTIYFDETNLYDRNSKDITPQIFKELNSYKVDNNILKSKPTFKDLEEMIDKREVVEKKTFKPKEKPKAKDKDLER